MLETFHNETCKCCHGTGTQYNKITGMTVLCPCCGGKGYRRVSSYEGLSPGVYCCTSSGSNYSY